MCPQGPPFIHFSARCRVDSCSCGLLCFYFLYIHRLQGQVHRYFLKKFLFWAVKVGMFAGVCTYHQTIRQQNEQLMCLHKRQNVNTGGRDHSAPHTKLQPLAVSRTQSQAVPPPSRHQTLLEEEDTSLCNVQASNVYIVYDMCRLDIYNCDFYSSKNCAMFTAEDELKGFQIHRLKKYKLCPTLIVSFVQSM